MIYCFDTSAINDLVADPEVEHIVTGLRIAGSTRITAFNVLEAAKTKEPLRRVALIKLMKKLAGDTRPLDRPNTILLNYADAYARRDTRAYVNADPNLEGLWIALNEPELLDSEERIDALHHAAELEESFLESITGERELYQSAIKPLPYSTRIPIASTLRSHLSHPEKCRDLVAEVYERRTNLKLDDRGYREITKEPVWVLYFLAHAYAFHHRSIKRENYSNAKNAGAIDMLQSVYLTLCDRFITADAAQHKALRLLNVLNDKRRSQVLLYSSFRRNLLLA